MAKGESLRGQLTSRFKGHAKVRNDERDQKEIMEVEMKARKGKRREKRGKKICESERG